MGQTGVWATGAGLKVCIYVMPVETMHWTLDRQAYRHTPDLEILSLECVGANGLTIIHTGAGNKGPGWTKGGDGAAYVMPEWAGRMASNIYKACK